MKKTTCSVCKGDALPLYIRVKICGEEKKGLQFVRYGTMCEEENCRAAQLDGAIYRRTPLDPAKVAAAKVCREEEIKQTLIEVLREPEFNKMLRKRMKETSKK